MVQNNKILTVSYGTFSCTLEGFDDAFGTMKAIAEYFRDLAAEDRYFGAEPPQPDADMLAHIAQKEIARRVEAHQGENGIVLRAEDAAAMTAASAAAATTQAATAQPIAAPVEEQDAPAAAESAPAETSADVTPASSNVSDLIDAQLASNADEPDEDDTAIAAGDAVLEVAGDDTAETVEPDTTEDDIDATSAFFADSTPSADAAYDDADAAADAGSAEPQEVQDSPVAERATATEFPPADDSIAAKLQRIRAVVSRTGSEPGPANSLMEDEHAEPLVKSAATNNISDLISRTQTDDAEDAPAALDLSDPVSEQLDALDPAEDADAAPAQSAPDDALISEALQNVGIHDDGTDLNDLIASAKNDDADTADAASDEEDVSEEAAAEATRASIVKVSREEFDALLAADRGETVESNEAEASDSTDDLVAEISATSNEDEGDMVSEVATDLDADDADDADDMTDAAPLSEEDEADLLRELAEVEAELNAEDAVAVEDDADDADMSAEEYAFHAELDSDETDLDDADEVGDFDSLFAEDPDGDDILDDEDTSVERAILSGENDVSRLLDEADNKLSDPETSDRRNQFAHLRAAMAAGHAEEAAGGSMLNDNSEGEYRDDLARVVKPRRPDAGETREERRMRPDGEKPAPLKLVAAQRVDGETAPVQPRRVLSQPTDDSSDDAGGKMRFVDYAAGVGAVELPDLLEAAAAYLSFVEGQDQFSRPQLMTKVRMVEKEEFSREDGLRSFGLLLRDGKIEKTQAGRFTVSDRIGFRPEDVRAVG